MLYVNDLCLVINPADQTIMVAPDIEHSTFPHGVGVRIDFSHLCEVLPFRSFCNPEPRIQRRLGIRVNQREFAEGLPAYHVHMTLFSVSQNENQQSRTQTVAVFDGANSQLAFDAYRLGTMFTRTEILVPLGRSNCIVYSPRKPGPGCQ
jgi:hypothetical protein